MSLKTKILFLSIGEIKTIKSNLLYFEITLISIFKMQAKISSISDTEEVCDNFHTLQF